MFDLVRCSYCGKMKDCGQPCQYCGDTRFEVRPRAVQVSDITNDVLGLLDAAAAKMQLLIKTETNEHNQRLYDGIYRGINSERGYVAELERANRQLMPDAESDADRYKR